MMNLTPLPQSKIPHKSAGCVTYIENWLSLTANKQLIQSECLSSQKHCFIGLEAICDGQCYLHYIFHLCRYKRYFYKFSRRICIFLPYDVKETCLTEGIYFAMKLRLY